MKWWRRFRARLKAAVWGSRLGLRMGSPDNDTLLIGVSLSRELMDTGDPSVAAATALKVYDTAYDAVLDRMEFA